MSNPPIRIGTRASRLALAQAGEIRNQLTKLHPKERFKLVKIRTAGDEFKGVEIFKKTGIGIFTKAIEKKLLSGAIDLAVHSLKDLPTRLPAGLVLAAVPKRITARDVLISKKRYSLRSLPAGARVGTGSARRAAQIRLVRPDVQIVPMRGNLDTRISKSVRTGELEAVALAEAGLQRIGRYGQFLKPISESDMLPAVGQGALGIQARARDKYSRLLASALHSKSTALMVDAERTFLKTLGGGCRVPVGVMSRIEKDRLYFEGAVFSTVSSKVLRGSFLVRHALAQTSAKNLAKKLLKKGARQLLREARA